MARQDPQLKLRISEALKAKIVKAAAANNRSLNSEIVSLIEDGFEQRDHLDWLNEQHKHMMEEADDLEAQFARDQEAFDLFRASPPPSPPPPPIDPEMAIYVLLDADGFPSSWPEIYTHLGRLAAKMGADPVRVEARVFDTTLQPSDSREEEWLRLVRHYRKLKKSAYRYRLVDPAI